MYIRLPYPYIVPNEVLLDSPAPLIGIRAAGQFNIPIVDILKPR